MGLIKFDQFVLDCDRYELLRAGQKVKLEKIPMELLTLLALKNGHLVTREEIVEHLWGTDVFVDTEHGINTAVRKIRRALKDDPERPRFVQTVTGKGYRFVAEQVNGDRELKAVAEEDLLLDPLVPDPPKFVPRRRHQWWYAAIAVTLLLLAPAVYWVTSPPPMPRIVRSYALTKTGLKKAPELQSRVLTDESAVYFQEAGPSHVATMRAPAGGGEVTELPVSARGSLSDISPDGSEALFVAATASGTEAWAQPLPAGAPRLIVKDARFPTWTADGRNLLFASRGDRELWQVSADGTGAHRLADFPDISGIAVSPVSGRIRLVDFASPTLWEVSPDGTNAKAVLTETAFGRWSPDGKYFFFLRPDADQTNQTDLWVRSEERHWWKRNAPARQLTYGPLSIGLPVMSKDGHHVYAVGSEPHGELSVYDNYAKAFVPYLGGIPVCMVDFSRDGQWIAYVSYPERTLWRSRIDGSERRRLTLPPLAVLNPRWSPDGKRIVFWAGLDRSHPERTQTYVVSAEGGGPMLLPTNGKNSADPTWSADGESVAYDDALSGKFREIAILDLATQKSSKVPGSDGLRSARWSPDGKYLVALGGFPSKLWLFSFDTQKWSELTSGDPNWPSWSRDSKYVYFLLSTNSVARVRISDHKVERLVSLQGFPFTARAWVGVTPDGRVMMTRDKGIEEVYAFDLDYK